MFNGIGNKLFQGAAHLSHEQIVAYLDGELSSAKSAAVAKHLKSCWNCRAEAQRIENAIADFARQQRESAETHPPEGNWGGFRARLHAAARQPAAAHPRWHRPAWMRLSYSAALSVAGVALILWFSLAPAKPVMAGEVLRRADVAETAQLKRLLAPVMYQKIRIQRKAGARTASALLESWTDAGTRRRVHSGRTQLWDELQAIMERGGMEGTTPISSIGYGAWRRKAPNGRDQVISRVLEDGSDALEIRTDSGTAPAKGEIAAASLVVRTRDWHPVEQVLKVGAGGETIEYALTEVAYTVASRDAVRMPASEEGTPEAAPASANHQEPAASTPAVAVAPGIPAEALELRIHAALHRAQACLGENIEIRRTGSGLFSISGVVEDTARRQSLTAALQNLPDTMVEVTTLEEYGRRDRGRPAPEAGQVSVHRAVSALEEQVRGKMGEGRFQAIANRLVELSDTWMSHGWAVETLARAFPPEKAAKLSPEERALLGGMLVEHAAALANAAGEARAQYRQVYSDGGPERQAASVAASWQAETHAVLHHAQLAQSLTHAIFSGTGSGGDDAPARLREALADIENGSRQLEAMARLLSAAPAGGGPR